MKLFSQARPAIEQIVEIIEKLRSGESKKYSELRNAICDYYKLQEKEFTFSESLTKKQGKEQLLDLADRLIAEYQENTEDIEQTIDDNGDAFWESVDRQLPMITKMRAEREPFFEAVGVLLKDNPNIFTADGLNELGDEAEAIITFEKKRKLGVNPVYPSLDWSVLAKLVAGLDSVVDEAVFRRAMAAPGEFVTDEVKTSPSDSPMAQMMKTMFTKDDLVRMDATRRIYENIRLLQDIYRISGLTSTEFSCRGLTINYQTESFLLHLQKKDGRKLWREVSKLTDCFLQLAAMGNPKYKLSRVNFSDHERFGDAGEDLPTTYSQLRNYASKAKAAWINHESVEWEQKSSKIVSSTQGEIECVMGHHVDRPNEPDTIELHLTMDWDDFQTGSASDSVTFRLSHPYRD